MSSTLNYGAVSAECVQIANDMGQPVDTLCGTAKLQCETVGTSLGLSAQQLCGGRERQVVTIQALQFLNLP